MKQVARFIILISLCLAFFSSAANSETAKESGSLKYILNMVHHNPGEPLFITKYVEPHYLSKIGYNGDCPRYYIQTAITYENFEKGLIPPQSATWHWIQRYAKNLDHAIRMHEEAGVPLYPFTDVLVIPKEIMDKYGDQMKDEKGGLSIRRPMTQKVLRAQINGIFDRFPDIEGLMTRFGETYLSDTPFHVGTKPVHSMEDHTLLINILREEICVKRNKKLFYRTWDFGTLHTKPENYLKATNPVESHPNLIFSIKHSNYDFIRDFPVNRTLGIGKHQQIIEVSLMQAGCYGKGAYPYYIGKGILHGFSEMNPPEGIDELIADGKIVGLYIWPRGDGWSGPYLGNEFWPDLNGYIFREFAKHPGSTDKELFEKYCRAQLKLSKTDTAKLYELCLLTETAAYAGIHSKYFHPNAWYQRDDKFNDPPRLPDPKKVDHQKILAEKAKAVADWKRIEDLSRQIYIPDSADQEYLEVSSTYGRIYFSILEKLWQLRVLDTRGVSKADYVQIGQIIKEYDSLWEEWYQLEREHSSCATLYMTCWPQTWPPTWREKRSSEEVKLHHDTGLVRKYRNLKPPRKLVSELDNPSFEENSLSGHGDFKSVTPKGWTGNGVGIIGVIGAGRTSVTNSPYGNAWLHLQGTGAAAGQPIGDISFVGKELKFEYLVTRRSNETTATDHSVKIVAGTSESYAKGIVLGEVSYRTPLAGTGTFNEVSIRIIPSGDPGKYDTLWVVFENKLSGDSQVHIDGVSCHLPDSENFWGKSSRGDYSVYDK